MKRIFLSAALSALLTGWGSIPTEAQEAQPVFDVQNAARQPWQRAATGTTPSDRRWASAFIGTVPQGKRLVIEFVAVQWRLAPGQSGYCSLGGDAFAQDGSIPGTNLEAPVSVGVSGTIQRRLISQPMRLYGNPGSVYLSCYPNQNGESFQSSFDAQVVGHLVDTQQ